MNQAYGGQSAQQGNQAEKPNLSIRKGRNPVKRLTPLLRKQERHHAFQYQHQAERKYPRIFHKAPASLLGSAASRGGTLEVLEKFGTGVKHHHIMIVLETGPIGFEAAVKLVELGILTKCLGIDA